MPTVFLTKNQKRKAEIQKIINYAKADGIQKRDMYKRLGISASGFACKQKDPGTFTLEEIWELLDFLHTPDEKRIDIVK